MNSLFNFFYDVSNSGKARTENKELLVTLCDNILHY